MARMYPTEPLEPNASGAEARLFDALNTEIPDDYVAPHSVNWLSREHGRDADGECDFLIAHPGHEVLY